MVALSNQCTGLWKVIVNRIGYNLICKMWSHWIDHKSLYPCICIWGIVKHAWIWLVRQRLEIPIWLSQSPCITSFIHCWSLPCNCNRVWFSLKIILINQFCSNAFTGECYTLWWQRIYHFLPLLIRNISNIYARLFVKISTTYHCFLLFSIYRLELMVKSQMKI